MKLLLPSFVFFFCFAATFATVPEQPPSAQIRFEQNKGQWPSQVEFKAEIGNGSIFLEQDKFTYSYYSHEDLVKAHDRHTDEEATIRGHAFQVSFPGCSESVQVTGKHIRPEYFNYFLGNDPSRWASHVEVYKEVYYSGLYPQVDLRVYSQGEFLKYDFVLAAFADPGKIKMKYEGVDRLAIRKNDLIIGTTVNEIIEQKPFAYQEINGKRKEVACRFVLKGDEVSFQVESTYDHSVPLIIDPLIVAVTYSGALNQTWGCCAAYDEAGNIYTGALSFGPGYPALQGAFQLYYAGGQDMAISKLNPDGSALLYATYIGGDFYEIPQSMVVNENNELFIYGVSTSFNYPTTSGCYSDTNAGFVDIIVTHLNATGSALIGSTYIGGVNIDGTNSANIFANYRSKSPGEIQVDSAGSIYVVSSSSSMNFPVTAVAHDSSSDAVLFKLDGSCSNLLWSTCIGGTGLDIGYGMRLTASGNVLITGFTTSDNFPTTPGAYHSTYLGEGDGFLCEWNQATSTLVASTYFGTDTSDASYLIDLDGEGNIYIIGETTGDMPVSPNTYGNAGSKNFIAKVNPGLSSLDFQTVFGNGGGESGSPLIPTAFFIDVCGNIYLSGYVEPYFPSGRYPLTSEALYGDSSIGQFYFAKLAANASFMKYATYFGGSHIDGGLSRFDKNGILYQAICVQDIKPIQALPGAFASTWQSVGNDLCAVKIDFQAPTIIASALYSPSDTGCRPYRVNFTSTSNYGKYFSWDFGDGGALDTSRNPTHLFLDPGNFQVRLIVMDSTSCNFSDTLDLVIHVEPGFPHVPIVDSILCGNVTMVLQTTREGPGYSYAWSTNENTETISIDTPGTYWATVSDGLCSVIDSFVIDKLIPPQLQEDTVLCEGQSVLLSPQSNGTTYSWSTGEHTAAITVSQPGPYWVDVSLQYCILRDSIRVNFAEYPIVNIGNDTVFCPYEVPVLTLNAGNPFSKVTWSTGDTTHTILASAVGIYSVEVSNARCVTYDALTITTSNPKIAPQADPYFCSYDEAWLDARVNDVNYLWSTGETTRKIHVSEPGQYSFEIRYNGCLEVDTLDVSGPFADEMLWVPSAFTPNGDGKNDVFIPVGSDIQEFEMDIFNRWGKLIFRTVDLSYGWDGRLDGSFVQTGVYTYKIQYSTSCSAYPIVRTGGFLLTD